METKVFIFESDCLFSPATSLDHQKQVVTEEVHEALPDSQVRVCSISPRQSSTTATIELAKVPSQEAFSSDHSTKMQHVYTSSMKATFKFKDEKASGIFHDILKHYSSLAHSSWGYNTCEISGSIEIIIAIRDRFNDEICQKINPTSTLDPSLELAAASITPEPTPLQSTYENFSPDALALLEKLPEGFIDGVHYDWRTGRVFIDKDTPSKEDERISKFQNAYQGMVSTRKLKIEKVPIPTTVSADALVKVLSRYNATYNQCVFIQQQDEDHAVKIVSTSSRQIDQAKKLLSDDLVKVATTPSNPNSTSEVIHLSDGRTLTLKKADIVKEVVDMIVNPANHRLLHGGGVAGALNRASSGQLQKFSSRYVKSKGEVPVGAVAVTLSGGSLKCKHVIHAVGPDSQFSEADCERLLIQVIREVLKCAERYNAVSISIPAISSGIFCVEKELVARCITDTIMTYYFSKPHPVASDIRIVIVDRETYAPFARYIQHKRDTLSISKKAPRPLIQPAKLKPPSSSGGSKSSASASPDSQGEGSPMASSQLPERKLGLADDLVKVESLLASLADKWRHLGSLLGFTKDTLDLIDSTHAVSTVYLNRLIMKWLAGDADSPTITVLVNALNRMKGTKAIVQEILKVYGDENDESAKKPIAGLDNGTNDLDSLPNPTDLPPPLEPQPADSADKNNIDTAKHAPATNGGQQTAPAFDPLTTSNNDHNPSAANPELLTTMSSGGDGVGQGQQATFKQTVYEQSSSASGVTTTTATSTSSLTPTTATSHPLQTETSKAAVSSQPPPGFFGNDLSSSSSSIGGNSHQAVKGGGPPSTGGGNPHYSQTGGSSMGGGKPHYSQASGRSREVWGSSHQQGTWVNPVSGEGVNNMIRAANPGWAGEQHYGHGGQFGQQVTIAGGGWQGFGTGQCYGQQGAGGQQGGSQYNGQQGVGGQQGGSQYYGQHGAGGQQGGSQYSHAMGQGGQGTMNYSKAVAGAGQGANGEMHSTSGHSDSVISSQPHAGHASQGYPNPTHASGGGGGGGASRHGVTKQQSQEDECPICLCGFTNPVRTKCGHSFCKQCIEKALQYTSYCPTCKAILKAVVGNQPPGGRMDVHAIHSSLPGYIGCGTIVIDYNIPGGIQSKEHPNPGQRFHGTSRRAFLPNNPEGQEVLELLKKAFNARLIFTVGTSVTSGQNNVVTWNDIHHKTNTHGGQQQYGYPDHTYLQRVKADLAAKGIVSEDSVV